MNASSKKSSERSEKGNGSEQERTHLLPFSTTAKKPFFLPRKPFLLLRKRFFLTSTLAFLKEGRHTPGYSLRDLLHGYLYARWPYLYISIGTGEHRLTPVFQRLSGLFGRLFLPRPPADGLPAKPAGAAFADTYHGKVVPLESAKQLVMVREAIEIRDLEKVIPYARARDIVLKNPDHLVALECPCRAARPNPCLPLDVCLIVGEPFASFVAEHHSRRSRWISASEAVEILRAEDERGHVHHAFFKDAMFGRFYAICNCCACCCGAMHAHRTGTPMLASSGYVAQVDESLCIGCGECSGFCQFGAIEVESFVSAIDPEKCMGCGVCLGKCAQGALTLMRDARRSEPLEIFRYSHTAPHNEELRCSSYPNTSP
jgi:ferredoxin